MLAANEIFGVPIFYVFVVLYVLDKAFGGQGGAAATQGKVWTSVSWTSRLHVPRTIEITKTLLSYIVTNGSGFRHITEYAYSQKFRRGDDSIKALPAKRDVAWDEFPITLEITYSYESGITQAVVRWSAPKDTTFNEKTKNLFYENARIECASWVENITEVLKAYDDETLEDEEEDNDVDGDAGCPFQESDHESADDYEKLGLTRTATWEQVQTAFRALSRTYHPDMLHHKNLPPEVVKLAEEKFKDVNAAYTRIKTRHHDEM